MPRHVGAHDQGARSVDRNDESGCHFALDAREHAGNQVETSYWRELGRLTARERPDADHGRTVYLVAREVDFGLGRMAQAHFDGLPMDFLVTRSYDDALEFLTRGDDGAASE